MKISVSIYSTEYQSRSLEDVVRELDEYRVDMFHIDCLDDLSVFDDIATIRSVSTTPIDLHIISSEPEKFYDQIVEHEVDYVCFQHEELPDDVELPPAPATRFGVGITSLTPIEVFDAYADRADFIMFMATTPGKSGGAFDKATFQKIRNFKHRYPGKKIEVDGGVNAEVSFILRNLGVFASVSGSFVFNASRIGAGLMDLRKYTAESAYKVRDFMIDRSALPLLDPDRRSFKDVLTSIDEHRLGFTILIDHAGKLEGIIANADVRKALLRSIDDLGAVDVAGIVNRSPVVVAEDLTLRELLNVVKEASFPITYLPVINQNNEVSGAVTFFNLVEGEL